MEATIIVILEKCQSDCDGGGVKFYEFVLPRTAEESDIFDSFDNIVNDKETGVGIILDNFRFIL